MFICNYICRKQQRNGKYKIHLQPRRAFLHPLPFLHHVNLQRANYQPRKRRRARLGILNGWGCFFILNGWGCFFIHGKGSARHTISTAGTSFVSWASSETAGKLFAAFSTAGVSSSSETETTAGASGASSGTANSTATATDQRRARLGLGLFAAQHGPRA